MVHNLNKKTRLMLFVSGILVFGITNSYAQDFNPQNLDFIDIEEMKMLIYLPRYMAIYFSKWSCIYGRYTKSQYIG